MKLAEPSMCKTCKRPFMRTIGKGSPQQYCSRMCRMEVKRTRNLANREKRRQERGMSPMVDAINVMAHEQMK